MNPWQMWKMLGEGTFHQGAHTDLKAMLLHKNMNTRQYYNIGRVERDQF